MNNKGYTMAEMLFAFSIFCIIVSFVPIFYKIVIHEESLNKRLEMMEWEVFASQVKKEIRMSDRLQISGSKLFLEKDGKLILYEMYGDNLRRRVDFLGHEVLLQQIRSIHFDKLQNGVQITVTDKGGAEKTTSIRSFIEMEVVE
ncbi:ComG operon protein [Bacillus methanolicus PB1]|uniref:ComG operon protein n=1 Tax=Bacillus methanolicus PB1 TaxID=997296 RepID=I3DX75_BACMT|nr:ComG operon protein [Bacillus methanolicus PB1]